jgi:MFS family permease
LNNLTKEDFILCVNIFNKVHILNMSDSKILSLYTDAITRNTFSDVMKHSITNNRHSNLIEPDISMFDKILNVIDLSKYNLKIILIILFFYLADGAEMIVLSLLTNRLGDLWDLSTSAKAFLGSAVFIGFMIGTIVSGKISDIKGRKPTFVAGALIVTVFAFLSACASGYYTFLLARSICGLGIGLSMPATYSLAAEITPQRYRSIVINSLFVFFPIGEIYVIFLVRYYIDTEDGWRIILALTGLPCLLSFVLSFFVHESPRFLLGINKYNDAFEVIQVMIDQSGKKDLKLTDEVKRELIRETIESKVNSIQVDYRILLETEYRYLTYLLWVIFFSVAYVYYGMLYILPQILETIYEAENDTNRDIYSDLIWIALGEIPGFMLAGFLADVPFLGRRYSMALCFIITVAASFACFLIPSMVNLFSSILKASINFPFNIVFLYACEAYPTKIRSLGLGVANTFTRFGGAVTPFITQILFSIRYDLPFLSFSVVSFICIFCSIYLPFETRNRKLN